MVYPYYFYSKDKEIQKYIDSLMKNRSVITPPKIAQSISRNKTIQKIRDLDRRNPYMLIGADQKYHISIIKIRDPIKITKIGDKYLFSF